MVNESVMSEWKLSYKVKSLKEKTCPKNKWDSFMYFNYLLKWLSIRTKNKIQKTYWFLHTLLISQYANIKVKLAVTKQQIINQFQKYPYYIQNSKLLAISTIVKKINI